MTGTGESVRLMGRIGICALREAGDGYAGYGRVQSWPCLD